MKLKFFRKKIKKGIQDTFYIWNTELNTIFSDSAVMIFFFLVPLVYPLIYSFIYNQEVVREAPLAVVDDSHTSLSRDFVRRIDA
ncbi:MAG: ABC transporter permease, partial [Bacteroidales bacterium]